MIYHHSSVHVLLTQMSWFDDSCVFAFGQSVVNKGQLRSLFNWSVKCSWDHYSTGQ